MAIKKINGRTFSCEPMKATEAMLLQARLLKLVGPALEKLGDVMKGHGEDKSDDQKAASNNAAISALTGIFNNSNPVEVAKLITDVVQLAKIARPSGIEDYVDMDGDMTGNLKDVIPLVVFVLREQFGDFFAGMPGLGSLGKQLQG